MLSAVSFLLVTVTALVIAVVLPLVEQLQTVDPDTLEAGATVDQLTFFMKTLWFAAPVGLMTIAFLSLQRGQGSIARFATHGPKALLAA